MIVPHPHAPSAPIGWSPRPPRRATAIPRAGHVHGSKRARPAPLCAGIRLPGSWRPNEIDGRTSVRRLRMRPHASARSAARGCPGTRWGRAGCRTRRARPPSATACSTSWGCGWATRRPSTSAESSTTSALSAGTGPPRTPGRSCSCRGQTSGRTRCPTSTGWRW